MLYIVLTACLLSSPEDCEERYIPVYADVSPMACMMGAQSQIAIWQQSHAELHVARWQCKTGKMIEATTTPSDLGPKPTRFELE